MKQIICVPNGKMADDQILQEKRKELFERLKNGEEVNVTPAGQIVSPSDPVAKDGNTLLAPKGKLA